MFERLPLSPVRPWASARSGTVFAMSGEQLEACGNFGARHEAGHRIEPLANGRAHAAAAGGAATIKRRHLAREAVGFGPVGMRRCDPQSHVARIAGCTRREQPPGVVAEETEAADQVHAQVETFQAPPKDVAREARTRLGAGSRV